MSPLILQSAARILQPLMLLVALFFLLRGHHQPGGGFVGGLVASAAYALQSMAFGVSTARQALRVDPRTLIGVGLLLSMAVALAPLLLQERFFESLHFESTLLGVGSVELSSSMVFDVGVFMVVAGAALTVFFALEETDR